MIGPINVNKYKINKKDIFANSMTWLCIFGTSVPYFVIVVPKLWI